MGKGNLNIYYPNGTITTSEYYTNKWYFDGDYEISEDNELILKSSDRTTEQITPIYNPGRSFLESNDINVSGILFSYPDKDGKVKKARVEII